MRIAVGSAFRNSAGYVERYMRQLEALQVHAGPEHSVRCIAVEGDSTDPTRRALALWAHTTGIELELITHNHGLPWFGSTEAAARLAALSGVGNAILEAVTPADDVLVYVESDLIWQPEAIGSLVDIALERRGGFDIVAPMVWAGAAFYDIWGFRRNGARFVGHAPYHHDLTADKLVDSMLELDSAGSCLVMRGEVATAVPPMSEGALVEWCANARRAGYRIGVHSGFGINHP